MNRSKLLELIRNGENAGVEFKRADVKTDSLAKEMSALLNHEGGWMLLGVNDDGEISGLRRIREETERWIMDIAHNNIDPAVAVSWHPITMDDETVVGAIHLSADSPGKPYRAKRGSAWVTFVRSGATSREASRDQEGRLIRYDIKAVPDTDFASLDKEWLGNYFRVVLKRDAPNARDEQAWQQLLLNLDLLTEIEGRIYATVAGLLLFGQNPNRRLPQAGITAAAFPGREKDYAAVDQEWIRGLLASMRSLRRRPLEKGVIDRAVDFVERNAGAFAWLEGARRRRKKALPRDAVREAIVNAVAHRDYSISGTDIEISLYADRLEVISPGRLPNGVTIEKMMEGDRAARNELIKEILRDYGYVEHWGMGCAIGSLRPCASTTAPSRA